ncbi:ferric reductase NAD binding domain-containing protein [Phaeosphaeria sp. MPI-PUGE-AT-0046c]|nr:ferric reductase NAD binding domain-containing protein [Phaeosphaeria sp. MPI-PUGE-AT-0046c]
MAAWLSAPVELHSMRMFECDELSQEECDWYKQRWHFWYIADYVFALPTIAFFLCTIGIFIIGRIILLLLGLRRHTEPTILRKTIAVMRYASYRGFHNKTLGWSSAPLGVLFLGLAGTIFFFCMDLAPQPYYWPDIMYGGSPPLATRSGWMALACMPFIFATATKTNWITLFTGVSHERLQVFHGWISYAFFILALLHTFPFIVYHIHWHDMEAHFTSSLIFYWTGIVALIFQGWLTFASHSIIRRFGYEFFKATHLFAAVIFMVTFFWHCDYTLTSWDYFIATAAVYVPCYAYSWLRTCFEYGLTQKATVNLDGGFIRVAIPTKSGWKPGQHCFLRFTGLGLWHALSSHPFTICSLPAMATNEQNEMVFYIRPYSGFTAKLHAQAQDCPGAQMSVLVDGPYGGVNMQNFSNMDHILLVAGGSGAGWCLSFVEQFLRYGLRDEKSLDRIEETCHAERAMPASNVTGPKQLRLALATRDTISRTWFLAAVESVLARYQSVGLASNIRVEVYLTGKAAREADLERKGQEETSRHSASSLAADKIEVPTQDVHSTIPGRECEGRPQLPRVVREEVEDLHDGQCLGVFVCGPQPMQDDVRNAVAAENLAILRGSKASGVYLHSEHFSWA